MPKYQILMKDTAVEAVDLGNFHARDTLNDLNKAGYVICPEQIKAETKQQAISIFLGEEVATSVRVSSQVYTSTTNSIQEGMAVSENLGVITSSIVIGTNIFSDIFADVRDVVGGKAESYTNKIDEIKEQSLEELKLKAMKKGCNAIIGISIDVDEISGKNKSMLMVTTIGTAVKVEDSLQSTLSISSEI
ncbi:YbjQ family protein [Vibrio splendidus]|uniref:YbjQ family protein n=1 Tax=Vibrio splendidus TaxID=29497 RepID=UPI000C84F7ED|nr:YbjQ family protein [Vibrio splendidus]